MLKCVVTQRMSEQAIVAAIEPKLVLNYFFRVTHPPRCTAEKGNEGGMITICIPPR